MIELSLIFLLALWIGVGLALWIGCGWAASAIMAGKGRSAGAGWALGLIIGIFGVLIAAVLSGRPQTVRMYHPSTGEVSDEIVHPLGTRACPFCAGEIPTAAQKCRHCAEWLVPESQRTAI